MADIEASPGSHQQQQPANDATGGAIPLQNLSGQTPVGAGHDATSVDQGKPLVLYPESPVAQRSIRQEVGIWLRAASLLCASVSLGLQIYTYETTLGGRQNDFVFPVVFFLLPFLTLMNIGEIAMLNSRQGRRYAARNRILRDSLSLVAAVGASSGVFYQLAQMTSHGMSVYGPDNWETGTRVNVAFTAIVLVLQTVLFIFACLDKRDRINSQPRVLYLPTGAPVIVMREVHVNPSPPSSTRATRRSSHHPSASTSPALSIRSSAAAKSRPPSYHDPSMHSPALTRPPPALQQGESAVRTAGNTALSPGAVAPNTSRQAPIGPPLTEEASSSPNPTGETEEDVDLRVARGESQAQRMSPAEMALYFRRAEEVR